MTDLTEQQILDVLYKVQRRKNYKPVKMIIPLSFLVRECIDQGKTKLETVKFTKAFGFKKGKTKVEYVRQIRLKSHQ